MTIKVSYTYASPVYLNVSYVVGGGAGAVWGDITGTLSNQADLQAALNAKFNNPTGTTLQYLRGDGSLATFPLTLPVLQQVRNQSGTTMNAGEVVYINGATGNLPTIARAIASGDATSAQTLGMVQTSIANNGTGYVVVLGTLGNLDTSAYTEGQQLYLSGSVAGGVTTTKQLAPIHLVYVGIVTRSHPTLGTIEVKVQNGYELDEIHDVQIISPTNGQVLKYNSATQLWQNSSDTDTGITSLNALTALSQTFATGSSGTDFNISSATSTHTFNLPSASATNRGLLTSADWTTFNNKQNALTNPITGTGTANRISKFTGTTTLGNSSLIDNISSIAFSFSTNPVYSISDGTNTSFIGTATTAGAYNNNTSIGDLILRGFNGVDIEGGQGAGGGIRVTNVGRVLIGSTTDNGLRFQVTGDGYFSGSVGIGSTTLTAISLRVSKNLTGAVSSIGIVQEGQIQTDVTSTATGFRNLLNTAASTTLGDYYHIRLGQGTIGASTTLSQQIGLYINDFANGTNRYGILSELSAGTGKWNLYMGGTAANFLSGDTGIGSNNTSGYKLRVVGNTWLNGGTNYVDGLTIFRNTASTETIRFFESNNVGIGTGATDAGFRLDVNGTMRVSGAATFSSSVTSTQFRLSSLNTAPATASSTGTLGEIRIDADYIYICTATNTWKRVAIATW